MADGRRSRYVNPYSGGGGLWGGYQAGVNAAESASAAREAIRDRKTTRELQDELAGETDFTSGAAPREAAIVDMGPQNAAPNAIKKVDIQEGYRPKEKLDEYIRKGERILDPEARAKYQEGVRKYAVNAVSNAAAKYLSAQSRMAKPNLTEDEKMQLKQEQTDALRDAYSYVSDSPAPMVWMDGEGNFHSDKSLPVDTPDELFGLLTTMARGENFGEAIVKARTEQHRRRIETSEAATKWEGLRIDWEKVKQGREALKIDWANTDLREKQIDAVYTQMLWEIEQYKDTGRDLAIAKTLDLLTKDQGGSGLYSDLARLGIADAKQMVDLWKNANTVTGQMMDKFGPGPGGSMLSKYAEEFKKNPQLADQVYSTANQLMLRNQINGQLGPQEAFEMAQELAMEFYGGGSDLVFEADTPGGIPTVRVYEPDGKTIRGQFVVPSSYLQWFREGEPTPEGGEPAKPTAEPPPNGEPAPGKRTSALAEGVSSSPTGSVGSAITNIAGRVGADIKAAITPENPTVLTEEDVARLRKQAAIPVGGTNY